jgi:hypothetical protein
VAGALFTLRKTSKKEIRGTPLLKRRSQRKLANALGVLSSASWRDPGLTMQQTRTMFIENLIPALVAVPGKHDGAKAHMTDDDEELNQAQLENGLDEELYTQSANSQDTEENINNNNNPNPKVD